MKINIILYVLNVKWIAVAPMQICYTGAVYNKSLCNVYCVTSLFYYYKNRLPWGQLLVYINCCVNENGLDLLWRFVDTVQ